MNILHVYRTYFPDPPGGVQQAMRHIALATQALGCSHRFFVLSPRPDPVRVQWPEGEVHRAYAWAAPASCDLGTPSAFRDFRRLARASDIVFFHHPWPFADLLQPWAPADRPRVLLYHSDIVRQRFLGRMYQPLLRQHLRRMDAIVTTSAAYARSSAPLSAPALRDRIRVIPLGLHEPACEMDADQRIFTRLGLRSDAPFFLFMGVLRYYKGLDFLLAAAPHVGIPIVIAGAGPEGDRLRARAQAEGLNHVHFAGAVTEAEKTSLLQSCFALVLPSHLRSEAFGMVLVEAAMHGKPMVSCEISSGTSFVNAHTETGYVVPPANPQALAQALRALEGDPEHTRILGRQARQRFEEHFSGVALGAAYRQLFTDVLAGRP